MKKWFAAPFPAKIDKKTTTGPSFFEKVAFFIDFGLPGGTQNDPFFLRRLKTEGPESGSEKRGKKKRNWAGSGASSAECAVPAGGKEGHNPPGCAGFLQGSASDLDPCEDCARV